MHNNKDQRHGPLRPTRFWVLGAGRFGQIAIARITRNIPGASLTVVDKQPFTLDDAGITTVSQDGVQWLYAMLNADAAVDMIVPAIPVHVAAGWMILNLLDTYKIVTEEIPDSWLSQMPHALRGKAGRVFVSHADFICPDNCPEPENRCTHTGKSRPLDMFRLLGALNVEDVFPIVLRSYQILPGVGGLRPAGLMNALDTARKNSPRPLMIATACRCHGVVDFVRLESRVDTIRRP